MNLASWACPDLANVPLHVRPLKPGIGNLRRAFRCILKTMSMERPKKTPKKAVRKKPEAAEPTFRRPRKAYDVHESSWDSLLSACTTDVRRLDNVVRFSSIPVTFSESTAAHTFWVSLYALMIWQQMEACGWGKGLPDLGEVLRYAISHDAGEGVTGDVVRTMKYSTPEMKAEVDRSEKLLSEKLFPGQVQRAILFEPSAATKAIVKAADWLSLWQFIRREAARHNFEMIPYYNRMLRDLCAARDHADPELVGLYHAIMDEAAMVRDQCYGDNADNPRWNREI